MNPKHFPERVPKVSVIVPMYNVATFIAPCLKRLLAQTLSHIEVILVDDGSADETIEVVTSLLDQHPHVILVRHETNAGVHAARITGLQASSGHFVGFVDSDDSVLPHTFESMYAAAAEFEADIVVCSVSSGPESTPRVALGAGVYTSDLLNRFVAMQFGTGSLCNKLFRRNTLVENPAMEPGACRGIKRSEDYVVNAWAFHIATRVVTVKEVLYFVTERPGSLSRGAGKAEKLTDHLRACRIGMVVFHSRDKMVARALGRSFIHRLSFNAYHPPLLQLVLRVPGVASELLRIAIVDSTVASGLAQRVILIFFASLKNWARGVLKLRS